MRRSRLAGVRGRQRFPLDFPGPAFPLPEETALVAFVAGRADAGEDAAAQVESAVDKALGSGLRTRDLGGDATTAEATDAVLKELT